MYQITDFWHQLFLMRSLLLILLWFPHTWYCYQDFVFCFCFLAFNNSAIVCLGTTTFVLAFLGICWVYLCVWYCYVSNFESFLPLFLELFSALSSSWTPIVHVCIFHVVRQVSKPLFICLYFSSSSWIISTEQSSDSLIVSSASSKSIESLYWIFFLFQ